MQLFAVKFREKGEKDYKTAIFAAEGQHDFQNQFKKYLDTFDGGEIDKRTISWAGNSIPAQNLAHGPLIVYANLDELT